MKIRTDIHILNNLQHTPYYLVLVIVKCSVDYVMIVVETTDENGVVLQTGDVKLSGSGFLTQTSRNAQQKKEVIESATENSSKMSIIQMLNQLQLGESDEERESLDSNGSMEEDGHEIGGGERVQSAQFIHHSVQLFLSINGLLQQELQHFTMSNS